MANPWNVLDNGREWEVPPVTEQAPRVFGPQRDTTGPIDMTELRRMLNIDYDDYDDEDEEEYEDDGEGGDFYTRPPEDFDDPQHDEDDEDEEREMTPENIFIQNGGKYCPSCGGENFTADSIDRPSTNTSVIRVNVFCHDCESTWRSVYILSHIENFDDNSGMDDDALKRLGL